MAKSAVNRARHHRPQLFHSRTKLKIGLVGGSFNPAHAGHMHMSLEAYHKLGLDQIWWLVSPQNPLKPSANMASLPDRLAAARDITAATPFIHVIAPEARLPSNFTYETLKYLNETMPLARLVWIMGADNLVQFRQWKRYQDIVDLLPIAVIDRPGYSYQAISAGRHLFTRRFTARQLRRRLVNTRIDRPGWCFIAGQRHHASATDIRKNRDECQPRKDETQRLDI
ncbi:MAG: nicotinate (nicotinamide) nucleotide adenylyltransferase [Proteobacteria bacterium]|nr:nicotinate (nicotinamide) nucleotide adenylyltransferase [Pseudomonadota bacterium]MDA0845117.1 nicotinate (nicotinamide) nucleotide adenylyltransferase [Pseudomonadota bacterium]